MTDQRPVPSISRDQSFFEPVKSWAAQSESAKSGGHAGDLEVRVLRDRLLAVHTATGVLIDTFDDLSDRGVNRVPGDLRYRIPEEDGSRSKQCPTPIPPEHVRFWNAFDFYHRSERFWRQAVTAAHRALDAAAQYLDAATAAPLQRTSTRIRRSLQGLGALVPRPLTFGTAPPMANYDRARLNSARGDIAFWWGEICALVPDQPAQVDAVQQSSETLCAAAVEGELELIAASAPLEEEASPVREDEVRLEARSSAPRSNGPQQRRAEDLFDLVARQPHGAAIPAPEIYKGLGKSPSFLRHHKNRPGGWWVECKLDQVPCSGAGRTSFYVRESVLRWLRTFIEIPDERLKKLGALPAQKPSKVSAAAG